MSNKQRRLEIEERKAEERARKKIARSIKAQEEIEELMEQLENNPSIDKDYVMRLIKGSK